MEDEKKNNWQTQLKDKGLFGLTPKDWQINVYFEQY